MATYTAYMLRGSGSQCEQLNSSAQYTFAFTNVSTGPSSASYFTYEGVRNPNGVYDENSKAVTLGSIETFTGTCALVSSSLITSPYIFSLPIPGGDGSFIFTPTVTIDVNEVYLRGTGNYDLTIS